MPLCRLVYASRAADALGPAEHEQILTASRRNNAKLWVTGLLAFSSREFLQCLEGSREAVSATYARILGDPRHQEVQLIDFSEIDHRWFGEWGMHGLPASRLTRQRVLRYSERELFTPTRMPSANVLALLSDLAAELDSEASASESASTSAPAPTPTAAADPGLLARLGLKRES